MFDWYTSKLQWVKFFLTFIGVLAITSAYIGYIAQDGSTTLTPRTITPLEINHLEVNPPEYNPRENNPSCK